MPGNHRITRRGFAALTGALAALPSPSQAAAPAARDIADRIRQSLGGDWPSNGPDGLKAGDPAQTVQGIATTALATLAVLQEARKAGLNMVITHEPTFFGRADGPAPPPQPGGRGPIGLSAADPVYLAKKEFIEKNGMAVFRLRDAWRARREDDMTAGLADALGWSKHKAAGGSDLFEIPAQSAEETVAHIRGALKLRGGLRAVGDRRAPVRRVLLNPGLLAVKTMVQRYGEVDMIVAGEVREWECTHYAADMFSNGEKRNLVTIGRIASEDPGMRLCADWLKPVVPGVRVRWISAGDPYWRAAK